MGLHVAALAAGEIFQLAGNGDKGVADRDVDILVLRAVRRQFRAGHGKIDVHAVELALVLINSNEFAYVY